MDVRNELDLGSVYRNLVNRPTPNAAVRPWAYRPGVSPELFQVCHASAEHARCVTST